MTLDQGALGDVIVVFLASEVCRGIQPLEFFATQPEVRGDEPTGLTLDQPRQLGSAVSTAAYQTGHRAMPDGRSRFRPRYRAAGSSPRRQRSRDIRRELPE